jgi:uncharacterized membrane protein
VGFADSAAPYNRRMEINEEEMKQRGISWRVCVIATVLWDVCILISVYLLYGAMTGAGMLGCSEDGKGCGSVLATKWSNVLGVPVTVPAIVVYVLAIGCLWVCHLRPNGALGRGAGRLLMLLIGAMAAAGAWFTYAQIGLIGQVCWYCTTTHALGIIGGGVVFFGSRDWRKDGVLTGVFPGTFKPWAWVAVGMVWAMLLPGMARDKAPQVTSLKAASFGKGTGYDVDSGKGADRVISILEGRLFMKPEQFPILGSPDAKVVLVEMFDYTCPHCRNMSGVMERARARYGGELAVIPLYTALAQPCNKMASYNVLHMDSCALGKMGIAVSRIDREKWKAYDAFVMKGEYPPPLGEVRAFAEGLVGKERLAEEMAKAPVESMVQTNLEIYRQIKGIVGAASLPILIHRGEMIIGYPSKEEDLFKLMEKSFGLVPVGGAQTRPAETQAGK